MQSCSLTDIYTYTYTHTHTPVSFAEPNCRRNWSHLSTGWIPTLHQRMQKIGEHLDSGDDTSICAAPVTGALQFLPCGGVRSAGHLPSCLAEAWSTGTGPWNWRPGLACQPKSLSLSPSPSLASQVLITVPLVSLLRQNSPLLDAPDPYFSIQSSAASQCSCSTIIPTAVFPSLEQHQIPINSLPAFVPVLAAAASISAPQLSQISKMSPLCIAVCPAVIPGCDGWEWSLSRPSARTFWWIKEAKSSSHPLHGILSLIKCH